MSTPTRALARRVVELACLAPSVHNTQPWRWRLVGDATIELFADRTRQLAVSDPTGRNLVVSCGAALHHAFVAAQALGLTAEIAVCAGQGDEHPLARVQLSRGQTTAEAVEALATLESRCTDRRRFTSWPIPEPRLEGLVQAASGWGVRPIPITDVTARFRTEQLVQRAVAVQAGDPRFAEEQDDWIGHGVVDGIATANAVPASRGGRTTRGHRFTAAGTAGTARGDRDDLGIESSDGLVAICSAFDDQESWVRTGEAMSAFWLEATHHGFSVVPLSQVIEVEETRHALQRDVFDDMARPQVLLRVGWQETSRAPLPRTARRPVDAVLL